MACTQRVEGIIVPIIIVCVLSIVTATSYSFIHPSNTGAPSGKTYCPGCWVVNEIDSWNLHSTVREATEQHMVVKYDIIWRPSHLKEDRAGERWEVMFQMSVREDVSEEVAFGPHGEKEMT